jgi:hypothetical protein
MRFFHSGDLGDIIYSIPSMRALCQQDGTLAEIYLGDRDWTRSRWTERLLSTIEPLLRAQDFVANVSLLPRSGIPSVPFIDFSTFRNGGYRLGDTILERQRRWVRADADISIPWLQVSKGVSLETIDKIIINRTERWEGWFFPWRELVRELDGALLFIGLAAEHQAFCQEFGPVDFLSTQNLLDAARVIAAAPFFIGNQSVCNAIANGLHKSMLTEVCPYACDCVLPRDNALYCLDGALDCDILGRSLEAPAQDVSRLKELERAFFAQARKILLQGNSCAVSSP